MLDTVLLFILIFSNSRLATKRGRNSLAWGIITLVGYLIIGGLAGAIYLLFGYKGDINPLAVQEYVLKAQQDPIKHITIVMLGVGGGLLIRFILEKLPPLTPNRNNLNNQ